MMETIPVEGAQLSSLTLGNERSPAVVLLHGLVSGNMSGWYSSIASPLSRRYRVLLYDQRGHGDSTMARTGFDLDHQANDLAAVLAHYGLASTPVDLVGHSIGALIALRFALQSPDCVRRLVLVDAPMPACDHVAPSLRGVSSAAALAEYVALGPAGLSGVTGRRQARMYQRLSALFFESTLVSDVQSMIAEPDEALAALEIPVQLVYGAHSPCVAAGHHLHDILPQAQLALLDCGHYVLQDAPEGLRAHLERFLNEPEPLAVQMHA